MVPWAAAGRPAKDRGKDRVAKLGARSQRRGLTPRLLDLRNSGDTAGDRDRVVGYGAFAFEALH